MDCSENEQKYAQKHFKNKSAFLAENMKFGLKKRDCSLESSNSANYLLKNSWPFKAMAKKKSTVIFCCTNKGT